jgi:hypothetical protein
VRTADRIIVLVSGSVTGVGTHQELMAACSLYAELFELQATSTGCNYGHCCAPCKMRTTKMTSLRTV